MLELDEVLCSGKGLQAGRGGPTGMAAHRWDTTYQDVAGMLGQMAGPGATPSGVDATPQATTKI